MKRAFKGLSTRSMLVATMGLLITSITLSSLLVVRNRLQHQVFDELSGDLLRSVETFRAADAQRLSALRRENALLADLPSLRALMTTADRRTIADGAVRFWKVSGSDLFALADRDGQLVTMYTRGAPPGAELQGHLAQATDQEDKHLLLGDGRLFQYSRQPLFFGSEENGTLLGYVVSGYAVTSELVRQINDSSGADVAFRSRSRVVTSTLPTRWWPALERWSPQALAQAGRPVTITVGEQRYLTSSTDLSPDASEPLELLVMKSFDRADRARHELNRLLLLVGACALCAGTLLMVVISGIITAPLERLTSSVRAYGRDAQEPALPVGGTREVRELSHTFVAMSNQIREKNQALLESERLATIGRMASSVSHDLRHYLAAVYANAEFLVHPNLPQGERVELFGEIRTAVHGTTDLIDSLLVFSNSGGGSARDPILLAHIVERAMVLVRTHPEASGMQIEMVPCAAEDTAVAADVRQLQRAVYNLLLNACQATRGSTAERRVTVRIEVAEHTLKLYIIDNGAGVADAIRTSLFEPFVSQGKQNGTGLGLTMASVVAREHGGSVTLMRSQPGETIFVFEIARTLQELHRAIPENLQEAPQ